jgi:hypothetical protein
MRVGVPWGRFHRSIVEDGLAGVDWLEKNGLMHGDLHKVRRGGWNIFKVPRLK